MKPRVSNKRSAALTLVEVMVVILVLAVIVAIMMPALSAARRKNLNINCQNNLNEIGQAFGTWQADHNGKFPMQVSVASGGAMEMVATGNVAACFQLISSRLTSPKVLICPTENNQRTAMNFSSAFNNSNISYFVGFDANTNCPESFLCGDDNFSVNSVSIKSGMLELSTNMAANYYELPVDWTEARHNKTGNIGFEDGSVRETYFYSLRDYLFQTGFATNRLAIP